MAKSLLKVTALLSVSLAGCETPKDREWREAWEVSQNGTGNANVVIYNLREFDGPAEVYLVSGKKEERLLGNVSFYPKGAGSMSFAMDVTKALMDMDRPPHNPQIYVYDRNKVKPIFDGFILRIDK